jgi:hypothetical protein
MTKGFVGKTGEVFEDGMFDVPNDLDFDDSLSQGE